MYMYMYLEQHDKDFVSPNSGDGPSVQPSEMFFLRRLGGDLELTGRSLRLEEQAEFRRRRAGMTDRDLYDYSRRDFFALCRGEKIVRPQIRDCQTFRWY